MANKNQDREMSRIIDAALSKALSKEEADDKDARKPAPDKAEKAYESAAPKSAQSAADPFGVAEKACGEAFDNGLRKLAEAGEGLKTLRPFIEEQIGALLKKLDALEAAQTAKPSGNDTTIITAIEHLEARMGQLENILSEMRDKIDAIYGEAMAAKEFRQNIESQLQE